MTPETLTHDLLAKVDDAFELVDRGLASHTVLLVHLDSASRKVRYYDAEVADELARVSSELATLPQPTKVQLGQVRERLQRWVKARADARLRGATSQTNRPEPVESRVEAPAEVIEGAADESGGVEPIVSPEELELEEEAEPSERPRRTL